MFTSNSRETFNPFTPSNDLIVTIKGEFVSVSHCCKLHASINKSDESDATFAPDTAMSSSVTIVTQLTVS